MFLKLAAVLLLVQVAFAQLPPGVDENTLYQAVMPYDQYAQGYGGDSVKPIERIDNAPVELPVQEETRPGQDQVVDHTLPDEHREGRVDQTKEIHNYQIQRRIINVNNRILHRYLKNLLVNTIYNTNIQRVNHQKLMNVLVNILQETHQPKLLVKYSRQDTTNDLGERNEQPEVSEERQDRVLPPVFVPATAEKIGYNGQALGSGVGASGSSGFSGASLSSSGSSSGFSGGSGISGRSGYSDQGSNFGQAYNSGSSYSGPSSDASQGGYSSQGYSNQAV